MEIVFGALCIGWLPLCSLIVVIMAIKAPNSFRKHFLLYALVIGMMAYCYEPTYEIDLSRYFYQLDYCRTIPFSQAFTWAKDGFVVKNLLFWIISRLGDNHILPLLSMTTIFGVATYICIDSTKESDIRPFKILAVQLMLLPLYNTLSNVRNVVAFALIILAVYRDLVYKKRNIITILLYILPCFIHMAGLAMVLIRMILPLVKKKPYLGLILTLGIPTASIALFERVGHVNFPGNLGKIVSRAIWKAYSSTVNTSDYAATIRESGYFKACRIVMFPVCLILLLVVIQQLRSDRKEYREYKTFCGILIAITMIWIALGTVKYWVFAFAVIIASGPVLGTFYDWYEENRYLKSQLMRFSLILLMFARWALEMYFISSRIILKDYFSCALSCSLWMIIGKAMKYILVG